MPRIFYRTGRDYGAPQVLEITYSNESEPDHMGTIPAQFADEVRGIRGTVQLFDWDFGTRDTIGAAVLAAYDAGRYTEF